VLDESHWQATLHGTPLNLTRREFKLLQVLARQRGRIFSRAQLLDQAHRRASQMVEEARSQAQAEGERIKAQARDEIEQETNRARDALRAQVAALAVAGAEKILQAQVDAQAHSAMLNKLASEL